MLEALEHPLGSPRIFEAKEREECFAPKRKESGAKHSPLSFGSKFWGTLKGVQGPPTFGGFSCLQWCEALSSFFCSNSGGP